MVKNSPIIQENRIQSLGQEGPLEKEWQPTPVFLPGESHGQEPDRLQSMKSQRIRHTTEQLTLHIAVKKILNLLLIGG